MKESTLLGALVLLVFVVVTASLLSVNTSDRSVAGLFDAAVNSMGANVMASSQGVSSGCPPGQPGPRPKDECRGNYWVSHKVVGCSWDSQSFCALNCAEANRPNEVCLDSKTALKFYFNDDACEYDPMQQQCPLGEWCEMDVDYYTNITFAHCEE